jgi:glucose dehydrogenase
VLALAPLTAAAQGPGVENGLWTYLGGDAWHTRYTPADEITAENFEELTMLWRFNAASFGPSTPRATPSYVGDKLITVTGDRRHVIALDPTTGELKWSFTEPNTHRYEYSMRKGYGKGVAYANVPGAARWSSSRRRASSSGRSTRTRASRWRTGASRSRFPASRRRAASTWSRT